MSARPFITCRELIEFIIDYFEGSLAAAEAEEFQRHLAVCVSCQAYLATYEKTIRASKGALRGDDEANEDAPEDLIRAVLKVKRGAKL